MPINPKNKTCPLDSESLKLLGSNLHSWRLEKQISIKKAAQISKLSIDEIDTIERAAHPFIFDNYLKLAKHYHLKLYLAMEEDYVG